MVDEPEARTAEDEEDVPPDPATAGLRAKAGELFRVALDAVDPARLVLKTVAELPTPLRQAFLQRKGKLCIVSVGKAALSLASAAEDALPRPAKPPGRLAQGFTPPPPPFGLVVTKDGAAGTRPRLLEVRTAGHPAPDERSAKAAKRVLAMLHELDERDLSVVLISGGASALLACPPPGVEIGDVRKTTRLLMHAGVPIASLNAVRKHLSLTGGGVLAAAAHPATQVTFVVSDVPGNRLDTIGSGPTVPDPTTYRDARRILDEAGVAAQVPAAVLAHLERGIAGEFAETRKPGDACFHRARTLTIGTNRTALDAAAARARELGYRPFVLVDELIGEAREVGMALGRRLKQLAGEGRGPLALIAGGETTVRVTGDGQGGRCQELALAAARELDGCRGVALLVAGTDGEDGPTDAAGAVVDGETAALAKRSGVSIADAIVRNDSHTALEALDCLVRTGPTGTNVMDVAIGLVA